MMKYVFTSIQEIGVETNLFVRIQSESINSLLDKAVEFMTNTKDPSHGIDHLNYLLKNVNRFFRAMGNTFNIDREVLLLAIYWHDVWKSQHKPTSWNFLFHQLYEGWGSMFMFRKYAKRGGLPSRIIRAVSYAIRKHSAFQLHPATTLVAQLLWDIDTLDVWNSQRIKTLFKDSSWTNVSFFDSYILYMRRIGFHLNFEWTKNELKKIEPLFFKEMEKFRENLVNRTTDARPVFMQSKAISTKWNLNNKS